MMFFCDVAATSSDTRINELTHRIKTATHSDRLLNEKKRPQVSTQSKELILILSETSPLKIFPAWQEQTKKG